MKGEVFSNSLHYVELKGEMREQCPLKLGLSFRTPRGRRVKVVNSRRWSFHCCALRRPSHTPESGLEKLGGEGSQTPFPGTGPRHLMPASTHETTSGKLTQLTPPTPTHPSATPLIRLSAHSHPLQPLTFHRLSKLASTFWDPRLTGFLDLSTRASQSDALPLEGWSSATVYVNRGLSCGHHTAQLGRHL